MRNKIAIVGASPAAATTALLLAERDYADLVLVGVGDEPAADVRAAAAVTGAAPLVDGGDELAGSRLVVLTEPFEGSAAELAETAPDAVLVVAGDDVELRCEQLLEQTKFPRGRIVGVPATGPLTLATAVRRVVDAIALDRGTLVECVVRCQGERGIENAFAEVPVRLGRTGVIEIV